MAILHWWEGTHDRVCGRWACADDGYGRGRRGLRSAVEPSLHRKYGQYRSGVSGDVQDTALSGYFAGGVVSAYAGAISRPALERRRADVEGDAQGGIPKSAALARDAEQGLTQSAQRIEPTLCDRRHHSSRCYGRREPPTNRWTIDTRITAPTVAAARL